MIAAVIPGYNEEKRIKKTVQDTLPFVDRIIVVNDGSCDTTQTILAEIHDPRLIVLRHRTNLGKGAALKTGCEAVLRLINNTQLTTDQRTNSIIVTLDGDGQHPPEHIPPMLEYMNSQNLDIVFSVRNGGDKMPLVRKVGNRTLNLMAHYLFNLKLQDMWCGFRAIRASVLPQIFWRKRDYSGEIEMALKVGRKRLRHGEYIIPTIYHDAVKGVNIIDGFKLITQMLIWRITL